MPELIQMQTKRKFQRILLVSPAYTLYYKDVRRCLPPLGLVSLAAFLEKEGYELNILDVATEGYYNVVPDGEYVTYGLGEEDIKKRIKEFNPDIVGVSCIFSTQSDNAIKIFRIAKEINPKILTLTGGSHPTYSAEETLANKNVDYVILGESELPALQLLNALNSDGELSQIGGLAFRDQKTGEIKINRNQQYISDLNELPLPAYHLLNMERYFQINVPQNPYPLGKRVAQLVTSRGCSARCVFCTTTNFWGNRYRGRSTEHVLMELRYLKEKYNIDEIQFTDDNLTLNKKRALEILEALKEMDLKWCLPQGVAVWALDEELLEKMKESGCYQLTFAIESGNQYVLSKLIKKPLILDKVKPLVKKANELDIQLHAFFICGIPGETKEQMYETFEFARDCGFQSASFFAATPLVGSELLKICRDKGYLREGFTGKEVFYKVGNINTPEWTAEEVQELTAKFTQEFNKKDTREKHFEKEKY